MRSDRDRSTCDPVTLRVNVGTPGRHVPDDVYHDSRQFWVKDRPLVEQLEVNRQACTNQLTPDRARRRCARNVDTGVELFKAIRVRSQISAACRI